MHGYQGHQAFSIFRYMNLTCRWRHLGCYTFMPFPVHLKDKNVSFPKGGSQSGFSSLLKKSAHRGVFCTLCHLQCNKLQ